MSEYSYRFCPKCGARANAEDAYCAKCGAPLRRPAQAKRPEPKAEPKAPPRAEARPEPPKGPKPEARWETKPEAKKKGKSGASIIGILLLIGLFVWALWPETYYKDYAAAGRQVLPQLVKHKESVSVRVNTTEYNPFLGAQRITDQIFTAAITGGKAPWEGERLGLVCKVTEINGSRKEKKDGSDDLILYMHMDYYLTPQQEKEYKAEVQRIVSSLHLSGLSDYEKVRAIYNYICSTVSYDFAHLEDESYKLQYTGYAAAFHHTAVCAGVADLFYCLANEAGVETHIKTNSEHGWNFVKLDGKYYYLDATWDLGRSEADYEYFLKGKSDFNHYGGIRISIYGNSNPLMHTDEGYAFSDFGYNSPARDNPLFTQSA